MKSLGSLGVGWRAGAMTSQQSQAIDFYIFDQGMEFTTVFADSIRYGEAVAYLNAALGERSFRKPETVGADPTRPMYVLSSQQYREFKKSLG